MDNINFITSVYTQKVQCMHNKDLYIILHKYTIVVVVAIKLQNVF